ncbi:NfeD family protein [Geosporobacter ferrireducens]|uniref:Membrane protein NfeD2 N-terminal transmembrane domain-containing protein n=1 Tax=Geosporobacter ferrireducens TaxID=1424294 RepID=A0A1D8GJE3_9FIRM|nr:NfeD family protein [Geosporobacter ferrireducens]AOT71027.1 hypothetical protein Gferi_16565 [Geosporobacter ferrireducens]MTI58249.1 DUF1449 family protein [Geosporobacter ferrireducens]
MTSFFYILFGVGALYTIVTFLLGQLLDFMDFDADFDDEGLFNMHVSPFKPMIIAAFLTSFGGFGLIFQHKKDWHSMQIITAALLAALAIAAVLYYFVLVPLHRVQNTSAVEQKNLIGQRAKVTLSIKEKKFGKISYTVGGNIYSAPAKALGDKEFIAGEEVIIIDIQKNVFFVDKI